MSKELTEAAWIAQEEPLSRENAALLYSLGVTNCGCCSLVTRESVTVYQDWFAEEIRKAKAEGWEEGYETGAVTLYGTSYAGGQPYDPDPNPYQEEAR